jgi:hypothetical protein
MNGSQCAMDSERHEAVGQRGEACIIVVKHGVLPSGLPERAYALATGERLRPTGVAGEFQTLDGARTFRLRRPPAQAQQAPASAD